MKISYRTSYEVARRNLNIINGNPNIAKNGLTDKAKSSILIALTLFCMGLSCFAHYVLKTDTLITHFFYIPIILAGFWWGKRAIFIASFLGAWLLVIHFAFKSSLPVEPDIIRSSIFITISLLVSNLGKQSLRTWQSLHETNNYLMSIVNHTNSSIVAFDSEQKITLTNNALRHLTGYRTEDIAGKDIGILFSEDSRDDAIEIIKRILDGLHIESIEIPVLRQTGGTRLVIWNSANIYSADDKTIISTMMIGTDITDLKKEQEKSAQLSGRMRLILESTDEGIYGLDENGSCILFNSAASKMTGYSPEEVIGANIHKLIHHTHEDGSVYQQATCPVFQAIKDGKRMRADNEIIWRKDGTSFPVEHSSYPIIEDGVIKGAVATFVDITERKKAERGLLESNERLQQIYRVIPSAIFTVDREGIVTSFNKTAEEITGYAAEEVIGKKCTTFALEPCSRGCGLFIYDIDEQIIGKICTIKRKDGEVRTASKNVDLLRDAEGNVIGAVESFEDITEHQRYQEALIASEERYRTLAEAAHDMIYIVNEEICIEYVNGFAARHLGCTPAEIIGKSLHELFPPDTADGQEHSLITVFTTGEPQYAERTLVSSMGDIWIGTWLTPIKNSNGEINAVLGISRDITSRKRSEEKIKYMAYYDTLTDLPNRVLLNDRLTLALPNAQRNNHSSAVLFMDLDNFKTINDTLGHAVGDQLLLGIAGRLKECIREGDTLARLGGDEFVLLLPYIQQAEDAIKVAEKVLEIVRPPFIFDKRELHVTTSIGVALYPDDGDDAQTLLKNADTALYRAKECGRNNYQLYKSVMNINAFERLALENNLRKALENNEFVLYYQPQVDLFSGKIIGTEALIRWNHPELGLVYPYDFIALAEETGLIVPIGEWVLQEACKQNKAWQDAGFSPIRVSVNLSARQFQQHDLVKTIKRVLRETELKASYLELEITESTVMKDTDTAIELLHKIKKAGIHLSIDDFGTGYSSLSYLKKFPIDNLKIDRSFIHDVISDPDDTAITTAIISMAHTLNLEVIAEGAETADQVEFLRLLKCDAIQGYFFSQPLPASEISELLAKENRFCA